MYTNRNFYRQLFFGLLLSLLNMLSLPATAQELNFGTVTVGKNSSDLSLSYTVTGFLILDDYEIIGDTRDFIISQADPPGELYFTGDSINFLLRFTPKSVGMKTATFTGHYHGLFGGSGSLQSVTLIGTAISPLKITTTSLPDAVSGQPYSATLSATGGQGTLSWSATSLPPGFTFSSSGVLSSDGTQTQLGAYQVAVTVEDGMNNTAQAQVSLMVTTADKGNGNPNDNPGQTSVGEPIDVGTGNVYDQVTDYETAGSNKLSFVRYYNSTVSMSSGSTLLGRNWRSNYDRYLTVNSGTFVSVARADGRGLVFTQSGANWITDSDVGVTLTKSGTTWKLTDTDDSVETYTTNSASTQAILTSIQARNGYTQTLSYNASNQIYSVTDSYNRTLLFSYQNGLVQTVTTPDGLVLTYGYDSSGVTPGTQDRLRSVAYSTTPQTSQSYLYEQASLPFALTAIIDENGKRYASWTYDPKARGLSSQFGVGANLTTVSYNDSDGSRTVTGPLEQPEIYKFTALQGVPKVTEIDRLATATTAAAKKTFTYDPNGYLASETDWNNNLTTYVNDALGRPTIIVEASGTAQARTTTISYFQNYHLPLQIAAPELTTNFTYDASGNLLTKTLTDTTTTTLPYATKRQTRTWKYTWDNSLLTSVQSPRTDVNALTSFGYDASGALMSTTNALNQIARITQHTPGGLPLEVSDSNGVTTQFTYDARLRLTDSMVNTKAGILTTIYDYDPAGNLLSVTLPDNSTLTNSYDTAHRLIGVSDLFHQSIAYTLDAAGNRKQTSILDASGVAQRQQTNNYDALGQLILAQGGAGQKTQYGYDPNGNVTAQINPLNNLWTQGFDALNRRTKITDPLNRVPYIPVSGTTRFGTTIQLFEPASENGPSVTTFAYDPADRPANVTDPNGGSTTYVYDGFGEVIEKISPDSGVTIYNYDADGNMTQKQDVNGATAQYAYDALDRVTKTTYPADTNENVVYTYDEAGHSFGIGRLTTLMDAAGTLKRAYDERGNTVSETRNIGAITLATYYGYDAASRIETINYPSGWLVAYDRDVTGRATSITVKSVGPSSPRTVVSSIGYKPFGPVSSLTFGNGITETRSFDSDYRLTKIAAGTLQNLTYAYDAADNVKSIADAVTPHNSQSFNYDTLNHLATATGAYGILDYNYDLVGNRLMQAAGANVTFYAYAPHSNRLTGITSGGMTQTVGTTAAGNINATGSSDNTRLAYNQAERLASVTTGGQTIGQYVYDAFGQRLSKTTSTGKTLFQYNQQGRMLEETAGNGSAAADYIYLDDGRPIATLSPTTGNLSYLHDDQLGTPQLATNNAQVVVWSTSYMPFGQTGTIAGTITQNMRLPGQYADAETGWSQNGFRDYVPTLGRYLESDPVGLGGGLNTYIYVGANPLNWIDPKGLNPLNAPFQLAGTPIIGPPGEGIMFGQTLRVFDESGNASYDIDYGHDHGAGMPHAHNWEDGARGLAVPISPVAR